MKIREGYMIKEISTYINILALIILLAGVFACARHIDEEVTLLKTSRSRLSLLHILEIDCTRRIPTS